MIEVLWPLKSAVIWLVFLPCFICKPRTSGMDTLAGCPPSNTSDRVAVSPIMMLSRSSDAVKLAASAMAERKTSAAANKTATIREMTRFNFIV